MSDSGAFRTADVAATSDPAAAPLFSVLVANYQNAEYLDAALESIVAQTSRNWEAVVVDDASTDESRHRLERWQHDRRFTVIFHSKRRGTGAAFRTAADAARGELMGMLGADDALASDAIERMVYAHAQHPSASLINSALVMCDENLHPSGMPNPYRALEPGETLIRECPVSSFATFKRAAYLRTGGFDDTLWRAVDHDIYFKLEEVGTLAYVNAPIYLYRANPRGVSQGDNGMKAAQSAVIARAHAFQRRKGTALPNLTNGEFRAMMSVFHRREAATPNRPSLSHLLRSAAYRPRLLIDPGFWLQALRGKPDASP